MLILFLYSCLFVNSISFEIENPFYWKGFIINKVDLSENVDKCTVYPHVKFIFNDAIKSAFLAPNLQLLDTTEQCLCEAFERTVVVESNFKVLQYDHFLKVVFTTTTTPTTSTPTTSTPTTSTPTTTTPTTTTPTTTNIPSKNYIFDKHEALMPSDTISPIFRLILSCFDDSQDALIWSIIGLLLTSVLCYFKRNYLQIKLHELRDKIFDIIFEKMMVRFFFKMPLC